MAKRYQSAGTMAYRLLKPKGGLILSGTPSGAMVVRASGANIVRAFRRSRALRNRRAKAVKNL